MIEFLGTAIAIADLIDAAHAAGMDPDFAEVQRSLRPTKDLTELEDLVVSVVPRRSTLERSARGFADVNTTTLVVFRQRLAPLADEADDFDLAAEVCQIVADVEATLLAAGELTCSSPAVTARITSVEEAPDDDEALSAIALDEKRVITAVIAVNCLSRRTINGS
jgi:hypothetical protein